MAEQRTPRKKQLSKSLRDSVWDRWIGATNGTALCLAGCGHPIRQSEFVCGHIIAESRGGETNTDNLVPICSACNGSMGTTRMDKFCTENGFDTLPAIIAYASDPANTATIVQTPSATPMSQMQLLRSIGPVKYMERYNAKKMDDLALVLIDYQQKIRANMFFGCNLVGDSEFHERVLSKFIGENLGCGEINLCALDWRDGDGDCGRRTIRRLLEELYRGVGSRLKIQNIDNNMINMVQKLISYIKLKKKSVPKRKCFVKTDFGYEQRM